MIKLKKIFIENNNMIIPVTMLFVVTQKHHNAYVLFAFYGLMVLYVFFKFKYMHTHDKENSTKTVQKALINMALIFVLLVLFYFLVNNILFKKPF